MTKFHIFALAGIITCSAAATEVPRIDPETLELSVNGKPFFVRGMNYSPETLGWPSKVNTQPGQPYNNSFTSKGNEDQLRSNGLWFCAAVNEYAENDWVSACADNDLTGILTLQSSANSVWNKTLKSKWETDLGKMSDIGVNTIRLYDVQAGAIMGVLPKDHTKFLEVALKKGIHVIFPALTDYVKNNPYLLETSVTNLVKETCPDGNLNPAILAYNVGNEFALVQNPNEVESVKKAIAIIRAQCPKSLVTYSVEDVPKGAKGWSIQDGRSIILDLLGNIPQQGAQGNGLDFLLINEYRNSANGGLEGYQGPDGLFPQMKEVAEVYRIPLAIGETGEYDTQRFNSHWYNDEWKFILNNAKAHHVLGSLYFTYNDEPIKKAGNQRFMGIVSSAWPSEDAKKDSGYIDVPVIEKKKDYSGIKPFTDRSEQSDKYQHAPYTITYSDSYYQDDEVQKGVGIGRFDMFSDGTRCNYKTGQHPSSITGPCSQ